MAEGWQFTRKSGRAAPSKALLPNGLCGKDAPICWEQAQPRLVLPDELAALRPSDVRGLLGAEEMFA